MSKSTMVVDSISHRVGLSRGFCGKNTAKQAEFIIRETRKQVTDGIFGKASCAAIKASVAPQIKKSASVQQEFKAKFATIKESRKYSEIQSLITETDSIPLLKYILDNIYIDGKHTQTADELKTRVEYKIKLLKCRLYKTQFIKDRARFYEFLDKTLAEAVKEGKITQRKADKMAKYYRNSADENIMYSILSQEDKFVFPNDFDETNSAVLELRLRLIKELKK